MCKVKTSAGFSVWNEKQIHFLQNETHKLYGLVLKEDKARSMEKLEKLNMITAYFKRISKCVLGPFFSFFIQKNIFFSILKLITENLENTEKNK